MNNRKNLVKMEAFRSSRHQFVNMVNKMQSDKAANMNHAQLEELLTREGRELMRRLMQDHLDLRSSKEQRVKIIGCEDGIDRSHLRPGRERNLESVFGTVRIRRMCYSQHQASSVHPIDRDLNLPSDKYSHGLRKRLAEEVSNNSFDDAVNRIERTTGGKIAKRQAEQC